MKPVKWFDGHLDLAFLAEQGRDLRLAAEQCGGALQPAAVTFPALRAGNVGAVIGTIFIQKRVGAEEAKRRGVEVEDGPWCFDTDEDAGMAARRQLAVYERWEREGWIEIVTQNIKHKTQNIKHKTGNANRETRNTKHETAESSPLKVVLMMEGAMGISRVEEFDAFYEAGVRVVSLTWAEGSAWSGGDHDGGDVTEAGRALIARMDELGVVHDVSHLSERAFWTLMEIGRGVKVASHSNCRALLPGAKHPERHLSDGQIRAIANGGGIVGINFYSNFLVAAAEARRAAVSDILRHLRHMEDVAGRRDFLALGSDMDGGFARDKNPADVDGPEKLHRLAEALSAAGWSDAEIEKFAWGNWARVLGSVGVEIGG
jgi:membrane dipeptidase